MNRFEKRQPPEQQPEIAVESPSAEAEEVMARLVELAHGEVNPEHVGIIAQNLAAEVAKALALAESQQNIEHAKELASLIEENVRNTNEFFPEDFAKNQEVKGVTLEYLESYLRPESRREAA